MFERWEKMVELAKKDLKDKHKGKGNKKGDPDKLRKKDEPDPKEVSKNDV